MEDKEQVEPAGMYNVGEGVKVGGFRLRPQSPGKIWIERAEGEREGEGGEFPEDDVAEVIGQYYDQNL